MQVIDMLVTENRRGSSVGLPCFCTANETAIETAIGFAKDTESPIIIEATCNQSNQSGGYTGWTPTEFRTRVTELAARKGLKLSQLIFGGDHLGPSPWADLPVDTAMDRAKTLVRDYVEAGFTKIHLDASMACGGESHPAPELVGARATELCAVAEAYAPDPSALRYVIGTEVPIPGGEVDDTSHISATSEDALEETIEIHQRAFRARNLQAAMDRVVSVVVQPGVDFSHSEVMAYERQNADALSKRILSFEGLTFEAHSTDYQPDVALQHLVEDNFAFLKVGPEITFVYREAILALALIEEEMCFDDRSRIHDLLLEEMTAAPCHWDKYYHGDAATLDRLKLFGLSDRVRYYWTNQRLIRSLQQLFANLRERPIPMSLASQFFGPKIGQTLSLDPAHLVEQRIRHTVSRYYQSCGFQVADA